VAAVVVVGLAASTLIWAAIHRGCALPAPQTDLPPQLRAVGDFGQAYEAGDDRSIQDAATAIASSLDRGLLGTTSAAPVHERAPDDRHHDATVIPLRAVLRGGDARVVGAVVFLDDCDGRHYYAALHDFSPGRDPATLARAYPAVSQQEAAGRLEITAPVLTYADDPVRPVWRNPATGAVLPAG
jgi:hypothetical protein